MTQYSHLTSFFVQRAHVGFSLSHLTLEAEQASQLSRSLGAAGYVDLRACAGLVRPSGECTIAILNYSSQW